MPSRPRTAAAALIALSVLLLMCACSKGSDGARAERIILLSCDTLRADRLGVYGYERDTSPRLDAFARDCVVFEEAYSTAPMTQPAVSSMLTGRMPIEIGAAPGNTELMPPDVETLAEQLRAHGLATAGVVSNWMLKRDEGDIGVQQGFDHFDDEMTDREVTRPEMRERLATGTTDAAIAWLADRPSDEFFLWVHYQDPHGPYTPPDEFAQLFNSPRGAGPPLPLSPNVLGKGGLPTYQALGSERDPTVYRDLYDAEIRYVDTEVGRLLDWLEEQDLLDGSLIVFTSDHGEALGEHDFWFCHGESVYRELVRVPLLIRWPDGQAPEGLGTVGDDGIRRCPRVASLLDIAPTALAAVGLADDGARGVSLLDEAPPKDRVIPQDLLNLPGQPTWFAASNERFRIIWTAAFGGARLFDITEDPGETKDLAPMQPAYAKRMHSEHSAFLNDSKRKRGTTMNIDIDAQATLNALGYVGGSDPPDEEPDGR